MPATFDDDECYRLFILVDSCVRETGGGSPAWRKLREKLLPFYRAWHEEHPLKIHTSAVEGHSR